MQSSRFPLDSPHFRDTLFLYPHSIEGKQTMVTPTHPSPASYVLMPGEGEHIGRYQASSSRSEPQGGPKRTSANSMHSSPRAAMKPPSRTSTIGGTRSTPVPLYHRINEPHVQFVRHALLPNEPNSANVASPNEPDSAANLTPTKRTHFHYHPASAKRTHFTHPRTRTRRNEPISPIALPSLRNEPNLHSPSTP
jgi:hypothetical protein